MTNTTGNINGCLHANKFEHNVLDLQAKALSKQQNKLKANTNINSFTKV